MNIINTECTANFIPSTVCASRQNGQMSVKDDIVNDRIIATSSKTTPDVLEALSRTASPLILELIAGNANCAPSLLKKLAKHPSAQVRLAASENSYTSLETLWQLVNDEDADVRFGMAENHRMPELILKALCEDGNPYVACRASKTIERVEASRCVAAQSESWKQFRASETRKRLLQLVEATGQSPMTHVNRFFSNLYNYARAI
jgi:hypothetical protein